MNDATPLALWEDQLHRYLSVAQLPTDSRSQARVCLDTVVANHALEGMYGDRFCHEMHEDWVQGKTNFAAMQAAIAEHYTVKA